MLNAKTCMDTASVPKREEDVSLIFSGNIFTWDISLRLMNHWTLHCSERERGEYLMEEEGKIYAGTPSKPRGRCICQKWIDKTRILMGGYLQTVGVRAILPNSASSSLPSSSHSSLP